jgi:hypothetical protein
MPRRFISFNVSYAGDLRGLEGVHPGRNFKFKPFAIGELRKFSEDDLDSHGDVGLDLKYSLSSGLTLDATLNTDFSQVEVDEQQINLTRFSLFFPEKRDFFLENAGIFAFGSTGQRNAPQDVILFFSRRIGLSSEGLPLPILGGARLTGRLGNYGLGVSNMQTRDSDSEAANNYTVLRIKRNLLSNSELGTLFINRDSNQSGDYNRTFGVDANFRFWDNFRISSFLAATRTPGLEKGDMAGRIWVEWKTTSGRPGQATWISERTSMLKWDSYPAVISERAILLSVGVPGLAVSPGFGSSFPMSSSNTSMIRRVG